MMADLHLFVRYGNRVGMGFIFRIMLIFYFSTVPVLSQMEINTQPIGNDAKGRVLSQQPVVTLSVHGVPDIFNEGHVVATLFSNPTGSSLRGTLSVPLVMGVASFTDLHVLPGGRNFAITFSANASDGSTASALSDAFSCEGQEAVMNVLQQPLLTLRNDPLAGIPPLVEIIDKQNGQRLTNANPLVSVQLGLNVVNANFTVDSVLTVQAVGGVANFASIWLTKAATVRESIIPVWDENHGFDESLTFTLVFSCPGFMDVTSNNFEVNPIVHIASQPYSDIVSTTHFICSGPPSGCSLNLSNYLKPGDVLQTATLDIDVACTDFDQSNEYINSISVGGVPLSAGDFDPGPWPACTQKFLSNT